MPESSGAEETAGAPLYSRDSAGRESPSRTVRLFPEAGGETMGGAGPELGVDADDAKKHRDTYEYVSVRVETLVSSSFQSLEARWCHVLWRLLERHLLVVDTREYFLLFTADNIRSIRLIYYYIRIYTSIY